MVLLEGVRVFYMCRYFSW